VVLEVVDHDGRSRALAPASNAADLLERASGTLRIRQPTVIAGERRTPVVDTRRASPDVARQRTGLQSPDHAA